MCVCVVGSHGGWREEGSQWWCPSAPSEAALAVIRKFPGHAFEGSFSKSSDGRFCTSACPERITCTAKPASGPVLTEREVERIAQLERLTLARHALGVGFRGVYTSRHLFYARIPGKRTGRKALGCHRSAAEAALAVARALGPEGSAALAAEPRNIAGWKVRPSDASDEGGGAAADEGEDAAADEGGGTAADLDGLVPGATYFARGTDAVTAQPGWFRARLISIRRASPQPLARIEYTATIGVKKNMPSQRVRSVPLSHVRASLWGGRAKILEA